MLGTSLLKTITSHSITIYAHNKSIQYHLYRYGFGLRYIDAIRPMKEIEIKKESKFAEYTQGVVRRVDDRFINRQNW